MKTRHHVAIHAVCTGMLVTQAFSWLREGSELEKCTQMLSVSNTVLQEANEALDAVLKKLECAFNSAECRNTKKYRNINERPRYEPKRVGRPCCDKGE